MIIYRLREVYFEFYSKFILKIGKVGASMKKTGIFIILCVLSFSLFLFTGCNEIKVESIEFNRTEPITLIKGSENFEIFTNIINDDSI